MATPALGEGDCGCRCGRWWAPPTLGKHGRREMPGARRPLRALVCIGDAPWELPQVPGPCSCIKSRGEAINKLTRSGRLHRLGDLRLYLRVLDVPQALPANQTSHRLRELPRCFDDVAPPTTWMASSATTLSSLIWGAWRDDPWVVDGLGGQHPAESDLARNATELQAVLCRGIRPGLLQYLGPGRKLRDRQAAHVHIVPPQGPPVLRPLYHWITVRPPLQHGQSHLWAMYGECTVVIGLCHGARVAPLFP